VPDLVLILTPLLVLAVVLRLGWYGCGFEGRIAPPEPEPPGTPTLIFRATVAAGLTAVGGVSFRWRRPMAMTWEQFTVPSPTTDGPVKVYQHPIPSPEAGMGWLGQCEMVAQDGGNEEPKSSAECPFDLPATSQTWVYLFEASGTPLIDLQIACKGLSAEPQ
jgi:hypothetical protein